MTCEHRTARNEHGRNVYSCCSHEQTRNVFVTVRYHDQRIEVVSQRHTLGRVCDKVTGHEGVFHSLMSHCDTVAHSDSREHDRCTACHCNAELYSFNELVDVHMTGNDLVIGGNDTYQRSVHLFLCEAQRIEQRSLRSFVNALAEIVLTLFTF